jgi:thioredoxin-like negative regulator of GroEL
LKNHAALAFDGEHIQQALETAAATGKPLIIKVGAEWCGPCKKQDRETMPSAEQALKDKAVFVYVDGDKSERLAQSLGIRQYPTTMVAAVNPGADGRLHATPYAALDHFLSYQELMGMANSWLPHAAADTGPDKKDTRRRRAS